MYIRDCVLHNVPAMTATVIAKMNTDTVEELKEERMSWSPRTSHRVLLDLRTYVTNTAHYNSS